MTTTYTEIPAHHVKREYCETRPKYRRGRKRTAVRVFTISVESKYLIASNVPCTAIESDLVKLFASFGTLVQHTELKDYPREEFTKAYLIQYQEIQAAKTAKRWSDERYFFGAMLHVCYAPEYESLAETKAKIVHRRQSVTFRVKFLEKQSKKAKSSHLSEKNLSNQPSSLTDCEGANTPSQSGANRDTDSSKFAPKNAGALSNVAVRTREAFQQQLPKLLSKPEYALSIPYSSDGIPLYLPPPPPPDPNWKSSSTATVQSNPLPSVQEPYKTHGVSTNKIAVKPTKTTLKKTKFKAKSGYFHQKVLDAIGESSTRCKLMKRKLYDKPATVEPSTKRQAPFKPPPFVPRQFKQNVSKSKH